jgi:hypothetical protein
MSQSLYYEIPDQGHTPTCTGVSSCPTSLMRDFFQNPHQAPDSACLGKTEPLHFVTPYTGDPPLQTNDYINSRYQVMAKMPARWREVGNGYFYRSSSGLDITQIGLQSAFMPVDQWLAWLADTFHGERIDQPR